MSTKQTYDVICAAADVFDFDVMNRNHSFFSFVDEDHDALWACLEVEPQLGTRYKIFAVRIMTCQVEKQIFYVYSLTKLPFPICCASYLNSSLSSDHLSSDHLLRTMEGQYSMGYDPQKILIYIA